MELETGAMLDAAKSWLFQYISAAGLVVLRNVVQDLKRRSTCTSSQREMEKNQRDKTYL